MKRWFAEFWPVVTHVLPSKNYGSRIKVFQREEIWNYSRFTAPVSSLTERVKMNFATGSSPSLDGTVAVTWIDIFCLSPVSFACCANSFSAVPSLQVK